MEHPERKERARRLVAHLRLLADGTTFPAEREAALARAAQIEKAYGIVYSAGSGDYTPRPPAPEPDPYTYTIVVHEMSLGFLDKAVSDLTAVMADFAMPCSVSWRAEYIASGFFLKGKTAFFEAVFSSSLERAVVTAANLFIDRTGLLRS